MKKREKTERVVFHHSLADKSNVEQIRAWHKARGFLDIGYHFVILRDGTIQHGRDVRELGAHAKGKNFDSIGVCLEGNFWKYEPTLEQLNACARLYHDLCRSYGKRLIIDFHRAHDLPNACPGGKLDRADFIEVVYRACPFQNGGDS